MNRRFRRRVRLGVHSDPEERMKLIKTIAVIAAALVLIIVLSVIWGNALKKKAEESQNDDNKTGEHISDNLSSNTPSKEKEHVLPPSSYDAATVPTVNAGYVTLSSYQGIDWGERASSLKSNGVSAVSLVLYYDAGILNFSSKTAQSLGFQESSTTKTNLYEAIGVLNISDIHSSGCFYVNYLNKTSPEVLSVYRAYEAALIAEAFAAGFSDVLIFGFEPDYESALEASMLIDAVKALEPDATVGFALNCSGKSESDAEKAFSYFASVADFLAIDMTSLENEAILYTELERAEYAVETYNLRIIVPEAFTSVRDGLRERGYLNWQIVP